MRNTLLHHPVKWQFAHLFVSIAMNLLKKQLFAVLILPFLGACGGKGDEIRIEGEFKHLNQSSFYIYSTNNVINGLDTIRVENGKFTYHKPCTNQATLMLIFPNLYEQPIFVEPGAQIKIKGDVSNLREMEVKGTRENKLMTTFRKQSAHVSPPEAVALAEEFINENPASLASIYLLSKYFIKTSNPDYRKIDGLLKKMVEKQPGNTAVEQLQQQIKVLKRSTVGTKLSAFVAKDVDGKKITQKLINKGIAIVTTWSDDHPESKEMQKQLRKLHEKYGKRLQLLSVSLDASSQKCKEAIQRDSIAWTNVCEEKMFDSPILKTLGLVALPDNLVLVNGRVVAHALPFNELEKEIERHLQDKNV